MESLSLEISLLQQQILFRESGSFPLFQASLQVQKNKEPVEFLLCSPC